MKSIDEFPDVIETTAQPSHLFRKLSASTQTVLQDDSPECLLIGTHPHIPFVGEEMISAEHFPYHLRSREIGTPNKVLQSLRQNRVINRNRFAIVLAAFETHHFHGCELEEYLQLLHELSHGVVLAGDYAFMAEDPKKIKPTTCSRAETAQQEIYGSYDAWFKEHAVYTQATFFESIRSADPNSIQGFSLPNGRVVSISSHHLNQPELGTIISDCHVHNFSANQAQDGDCAWKNKSTISFQQFLDLISPQK